MVDIIHRIGIKAPLSQVYAAVSTVNGISGWWSKETSGDSQLGGTFNVLFRNATGGEIGNMNFELAKLSRNEEVVWRCTSGPLEWLGTEVTFSLSQQGDQTILIFGHRNWREAIEFTAHCSMKWATFLLSLRKLAETGKGQPSPNDMKIDNWN
ncbi:MAG TPA: SRPBCC domain-containing protein [Polyangiaceae bacterium]|nr:SRPBCC domain-containing protein [Polyangiaceae bacterium]